MEKNEKNNTRRNFLKKLPVLAAGTATLAGCNPEELEFFFHQNFKTLSKAEKETIVKNLEKKYFEKYGKEFKVSDKSSTEGIEFGYALDLSRCIGCRRCVYACVEENNQSR
ncbi:MAG: twin-arginine translocation signal domain-containing protein, partial [Bacteroidetes bacterium]|nr:twin-arginine translocation signal domain-containing protein [Bacteroidota bacterium]